MILRSGKYQGYTVQEVAYSDPGYLQWVRINRPEMLVERVSKIKKQELTDEEIEQKTNYKQLPLIDPKDAF